MPPVAFSSVAWKDALDSAFAKNKSRPGYPASVRKLAATLASTHGSTQNEESWKRSLTKVRAGKQPTERQAKLIATALGVRRNSLPPSAERMTMILLAARQESLATALAETANRVSEIQERVSRLEDDSSLDGDPSMDQVDR